MMITCEKAEKLVIQNLDTAELRQHLTGCSPCRQFQSDYEKIKKLSFETSENSVDVPISNDLLVLKYAHDNMNQENVTHKKKIFTVWFTSAAAV